MNSTEKRLNRVEEMANIASWAQDLDTSEFVCSPQLYNMLGLEPGNYMTPEGFFEFLHPEDRERVQQGFDRVAAEGGMHEMDVQLLRPTNGSIRNIHLKAERVPNEKSGREKLIGIFHDITEWQNLQLKEKLADTFLRRLEDGFLLFDQRGNIVFSNRAYRAMTGYGHKELLKKTIYDLLPDDERETFISKCHHLKESPGDIFIVRHKRNDETIIQFIASLTLVKLHGQIFIGGFLRDLAREQKVLETMNISNQHFQSLFEHNPHPVYYMDLEGNFEGVNPSMIELSGYSREELLEMDFTPFIPEKEMAKTMENFNKARRGEATEYEIKVVTKDNRHLDVRVTNFPMKEDGEITGVFGIAQDITEAKMLERKRKESEERWQRLVEGNPQPVQVVQDDKIVFINQVGAELYGARFPDEVIGRDILDFSHPETLEKLKERKRKLEEGKYIEPDEHRIKRLDGQERIIEAYSVPIWYNGKKAIQTVIYDVTDRRKQEEMMQKSLEEKEVLLQEIHHRVKNNLAVISGLIELQALNTDDPAIQRMLEESQLRVQSMAIIHEKLYQSESFVDIGFNEYIRQLVDTIISTMEVAEDQLQIDYQLMDIPVNINKAIPCALIINELVVNCIKHAFEPGQRGIIRIHMDRRGEEVTIAVSDSGKGLPPDFSVDSQQSLGMTLVQTLCQQLEASLYTARGIEERGTTFRFSFTP